jgi:hypothetical protein
MDEKDLYFNDEDFPTKESEHLDEDVLKMLISKLEVPPDIRVMYLSTRVMSEVKEVVEQFKIGNEIKEETHVPAKRYILRIRKEGGYIEYYILAAVGKNLYLFAKSKFVNRPDFMFEECKQE